MSERRKRLLFVQPSLQPPGGGNSVAAWMIQALRDDYDVTVLSWVPIDIDEINRYYGTTLQLKDFGAIESRRVAKRLLDLLPFPLHHLKRALIARKVLLMRGEFDVTVTANNETDFGYRTIQYVHFPARFLPRPMVDIRWYHRPPGVLRAYHALVNRLSLATMQGLRSNLTLVNSEWTGRQFRVVFGETCDVRVLHPPVRGRNSTLPWEKRSDDFVCVGRISPEKRVHRIVRILESVRAHGWNGNLHLIGHPDNRGYWRRIRALVQPRPWVRVQFDLPREALLDLLAHTRYGIHGMLDEHFGISIAEMAMAGCVVFVPNGGGQVEIVDHDERIVYRSEDDAVAKIRAVLADPALQRDLSATLRERGSRYEIGAFMERTREIVAEFVEEMADDSWQMADRGTL